MDHQIKKEDLFSLTPQEIQQFCKERSLPKFRSEQLITWIFQNKVFDVDQMLNLPKSFREELKKQFNCELPQIESRLDSEDGASKLLIRGPKNQFIEAVILRYEGRTSLCVSSQVGCKLACDFCQTGKLGFFRNLSVGEIVGQFCLAQSIVAQEGRNISHIVFMGMGEPLDNFEHVVKAVNLFTKSDAYGLSARRVTVSTSGIAPKIMELASRARASLAVSLHASRDELRTSLMPINRKYPLAKLKEELISYQKATGDVITIEYILIRDKNCGRREAKELVRFLHGIKAKVNLIPFNAHPGLPYQRPSEDDIRDFQSYLSHRGYPSPVRYSKGLGVSAACGQLAAKQSSMLNQKPARKNIIGQLEA